MHQKGKSDAVSTPQGVRESVGRILGGFSEGADGCGLSRRKNAPALHQGEGLGVDQQKHSSMKP